MTEGVAYLANQQAADGSFMGQASTAIMPFEPTRRHPTNFFTSLIVWCLRDVAGTDSIRASAVAFLPGSTRIRMISTIPVARFWRCRASTPR
jgi:hypothetical protein